jgi:hypothetical protein
MGTLSKRRLDEFGVDVKQRIDELRRGVGKKLDGMGARVTSSSQPQGALVRGVGRVSAALPASGWLALAVVSIAGSIGLKVARRHTGATFVAAWVPTFLLLGLYNMNNANKAGAAPVTRRERRGRIDPVIEPILDPLDDHGIH